MAQCMELTLIDDDHADLVCVVCYEPLHEGRRFDCFHLLCSQCAAKHVKACLSRSEDVVLPFGPVFCPQCREVTYVFSDKANGLPKCPSVTLARMDSQRIASHLNGLSGDKSKSSESENLKRAAALLEASISEVMARVRTLIDKEREFRDRAFKWAEEEDLIDGSLLSDRHDNAKVESALSSFMEEFGDEVTELIDERDAITQEVDELFLQKWVLEAVQQCECPADKAEAQWIWWKKKHLKAISEERTKENREAEADVALKEMFFLSSIFRLHRPYPGAVLPENRVKGGEICAELVWQCGQRGKEENEFDWPIHAAFIDGGKRIAVADKNNGRVVILNSSNGQAIEHLFKGQVKPRRVHCHGSDPGVLLVSDEISAMVKAFEMNSWRFLDKFGLGLFLCPTGVGKKSNGSLVYTDMDRGFLSVHNGDTYQIETKFTVRLLGDRYLPSPSFVVVDADNYFVVSDSQNDCIKILNERGGIVTRFGNDILRCPRGIAVDPLGMIFVADSDNHVIRVFDPFGKFLQNLDLPGRPLHYPMSLDYLPQERLLLVTQCSFMYHDHSVAMYRLDFADRIKELTDKECEA